MRLPMIIALIFSLLLGTAMPAFALSPSTFVTMPCSCMQPTARQRHWRWSHHRVTPAVKGPSGPR